MIMRSRVKAAPINNHRRKQAPNGKLQTPRLYKFNGED